MEKGVIDTLSRSGFIVGGVIFSVIGFSHFFMPELAFSEQVTNTMSTEVKDHFVYLAIYMLGTFLCALGLISLLSVKCLNTAVIKPLAIIFALTWMLRAVFELLYPVKLSLFGMDNPSSAILGVSLVAMLGYILSLIALLKLKR